MKLLLVEDNKDIAELMYEYFEAKGFELDYAGNGNLGLALALDESFDCIILDVMLPGIDGISICKHLRSEGKNTPIVMLTARDTHQDELTGLNCGADDYIVKPFELDVLEARIHALIRRSNCVGFRREISCGPLTIDLTTRKVSRNTIPLKLNPTCFSILVLLVKRHPLPVSRIELEEALWPEFQPEDDVLRKHIYQLRSVVDKPFDQSIITTRPKVGYAIEY